MLRVIELFGGIGAMTEALKRLGIDFKVVDYVEIDKYAVASYNAMNGTDYKPQDVTKWDKDIECDLIMHGSPCQDFSLQGHQNGGDEGSGTRSSLMWETVRIVRKLRPKYIIWENVRNVISDTHIHNFEKYLSTMASLGYANAWQVMNAKDYGVPQSRERVFVVSVMNGRTVYEAMNLFGDSEKKLDFEFPEPFPLKRKLKDILEEDVDEKYFISNSVVSELVIHNERHESKGVNVVNKPHLKIKVANKKGYDEAYEGDSINLEFPNSDTRRGRVGWGIAHTIDTGDNQGVVVDVAETERNELADLRIRKLTPLETWRLMGQSDEAYDKAAQVNSDTQLYKQAGNSIVVDILFYLTKSILEQNE